MFVKVQCACINKGPTLPFKVKYIYLYNIKKNSTKKQTIETFVNSTCATKNAFLQNLHKTFCTVSKVICCKVPKGTRCRFLRVKKATRRYAPP